MSYLHDLFFIYILITINHIKSLKQTLVLISLIFQSISHYILNDNMDEESE